MITDVRCEVELAHGRWLVAVVLEHDNGILHEQDTRAEIEYGDLEGLGEVAAEFGLRALALARLEGLTTEEEPTEGAA